MGELHHFQESLAYGNNPAHEQFWEDVYRIFFPNFNTMSKTIGCLDAQRHGVDRIVVLDNGQVRRIDEKKRMKTWPDLLLETVSNDRSGAPGWINKDQHLDFLAYAFMDTETVWFFQWDSLRRAWRDYGVDWEQRYPRKVAQNQGYQTISIAIPIAVVRSVAGNAFRVRRGNLLGGVS